MDKIHPIKLSGPWDSGFALDRHILKSIYLGDDQWGHPIFDNERSYIGQLLYDLKYQQNIEKVDEITSLIISFLSERWNILDTIHCFIPIPPSNIYRAYQPVYEICSALGKKLDKAVYTDCIIKTYHSQSKNIDKEKKIEELKKSLKIVKSYDFSRKQILLIDDLFATGTTLEIVTKLLKTYSNAEKVHILAMTKTKG